MEYLTLGKIVGTMGLKGDIKVFSSTDFGAKRYKKGNKVFLFNEQTGERISLIVSGYRNGGKLDIIRFKDYESINSVASFINYLVQVEKDNSLLKKDDYLYADLVGCSCAMEDNIFGVVKKIEEYASYQTLRVARENNKDVLIPFVKAFIKEINLGKKIIYINSIEGLL